MIQIHVCLFFLNTNMVITSKLLWSFCPDINFYPWIFLHAMCFYCGSKLTFLPPRHKELNTCRLFLVFPHLKKHCNFPNQVGSLETLIKKKKNVIWVKHFWYTSFRQLEIKCQLQNNLYLKEYYTKFMSSYPLMSF